MDIASIFVTKSFEWGIGKALDVLWECVTARGTVRISV